MKSVLISIQPKWCELIASGEKTVEVRKTKPKIETPFKVYIYQTLHREQNGRTYSDGKVIGEFVCEKMLESFLNNNDGWFIEKGCLTQEEIDRYQGDKSILYGWHISDLVIYDKPKKLREFYRACKQPSGTDCSKCIDNRKQSCWQITRTPQSWCYVEELKGE